MRKHPDYDWTDYEPECEYEDIEPLVDDTWLRALFTVEDSRRKQALPETIQDPATLSRLASLLS